MHTRSHTSSGNNRPASINNCCKQTTPFRANNLFGCTIHVLTKFITSVNKKDKVEYLSGVSNKPTSIFKASWHVVSNHSLVNLPSDISSLCRTSSKMGNNTPLNISSHNEGEKAWPWSFNIWNNPNKAAFLTAVLWSTTKFAKQVRIGNHTLEWSAESVKRNELVVFFNWFFCSVVTVVASVVSSCCSCCCTEGDTNAPCSSQRMSEFPSTNLPVKRNICATAPNEVSSWCMFFAKDAKQLIMSTKFGYTNSQCSSINFAIAEKDAVFNVALVSLAAAA